jgi:hypothetical protein
MVMVVINILKGMYVGRFVKYLLFRQILTKIEKCRHILLIIVSISIPENVIGGRLIVPRGQKDRQTNMTQIVAALRNYNAEASKNCGTILTLNNFSPRNKSL